MKKLINDPKNVVREMLEGMADLSPDLALLSGENVLVRRGLPPAPSRRVAVISGGGSGHEPAHAGYIGEGMLAAAVLGDVFTSPSTDAILAAIRAVSGPAGALLIVKNYTGDRLNFGLAAELARQEGIPVEVVIVADDVALRDTVARERRRGIAGTILIHKVAGAAAAAGYSLTDTANLARSAASELGTMGVGLGACTVPAAGVPGFSLAEDEIEFGLGIHGEKGVRRTTMMPADEVVDGILDVILSDLDLAPQSAVGLLVNGLGATPPMELAIVARRALLGLRQRGLSVSRAWAGNFMTALEMPGCSISVLKLDERREALLAAPTTAQAWPGEGRIPQQRWVEDSADAPAVSRQEAPGPQSLQVRRAILAVADALENAEQRLTELDSAAGDGDLGASMTRGASALRSLSETEFQTPGAHLIALGQSLRRTIAGSSGPFYATALLRAGNSLQGQADPDPEEWRRAFEAAVISIAELGGAKLGDRTMLDALLPAVEAWTRAAAAGAPPVEAFRAAAVAAADGARRTEDMVPSLGRASYLGRRALGVPDAGAIAVSIWMQALAATVADPGAAQ